MSCHTLRKTIQKTIALDKLSKRSRHGYIQEYLRWQLFARLHLILMLLLVKSERIMPLALLPVLQVKRWQQHMFPDMRTVLPYMPNRLSIEPPIPLKLMLP